jgi:ATP-binding protein involved in chromosome partitioning
MRIAVPLIQGRLSLHLGHCDKFALVDVDAEANRISEIRMESAPSHEPGALPRWLNERDVKLVIAGSMGRRVQMLLADSGIDVLVGVPAATAEETVNTYLQGLLKTGANLCDH